MNNSQVLNMVCNRLFFLNATTLLLDFLLMCKSKLDTLTRQLCFFVYFIKVFFHTFVKISVMSHPYILLYIYIKSMNTLML